MGPFRRKDRVILKKAAGCIPAGCYKFHSRSGEMLNFTVGRNILFGLHETAGHALEKTKATARLTTPEEFVVEYSCLLEAVRVSGGARRAGSHAPESFCVIAPSLVELSS